MYVPVEDCDSFAFVFSTMCALVPLSEVAVTPAYLERLGLDRADPAAVLGTQVELGSAAFGGYLVRDGELNSDKRRSALVQRVSKP